MHSSFYTLPKKVLSSVLILPFLFLGCSRYADMRKDAYENTPFNGLAFTSLPVHDTQHSDALLKTANRNGFWYLPDYSTDTIGLTGNACVQEIISTLLSQQNSVIEVIKEVFGETTKFNITFQTDSLLPSSVDSRTGLDPSPGYVTVNGQDREKLVLLNVKIKLNPYFLTKASRMAIAQNITHELLHAYFFYRERDVNGDPVKQQKFDEDFTFMKPYINGSGTPPGGHHEEMANSYIDKIASVLKGYRLVTLQELQQAQSTNQALAGLTVDSYYKALAWGGLQGTNAWKRLEQTDPQTAQLYLIIVACENNNPLVSVSKEKC